MKLMQAYIGLRGSHNVSESAGIPDRQMKRQAQLYQNPVHFEQRIPNTKWCVLRWPTPAMAQLARMSTEAFEQFYFDVCTFDYEKMQRAVQPLADRMGRTDRVRIEGPGDTDLSFSIKDIDAVPCYGTHNVPDGECFTSLVRDSVNGVIHFNTPTIYNGVSFKNVRLEFRDGRVVNATAAENQDKLDSILDTDEGARFVGEFALGFNPYVNEAMKDILFDEKIAGSLHLTPGRAYAEADNGNRSDVHWDLVLIQRADHGGGRIFFDDELIRAHGELDVLCPHSHLPVQSGSDRILERMRRRHCADEYRQLVDRLRASRPGLAITTDLIVGFPGETRADFEETLTAMEESAFVDNYSFKYSPRPGTGAAEMDEEVPPEVAQDRLERLQAQQRDQTLAYHQSRVGQEALILVEGPSRRGGHQVSGRDLQHRVVNLDLRADLDPDQQVQPGTRLPARIVEATPHSLLAEPLDPALRPAPAA